MAAPEPPEPYSLIGGPLHQLGGPLGLVRGTNTVLIGLTLGIGLWLLILGLAIAQGLADRLFDMSVVAVHARLLLVIPLFFACESWVGPRMTAFVVTIARTGVVPAAERASLNAAVACTRRLTTAWLPEAACLVAAIAVELTGSGLQRYGATGAYDPARTAVAALVYFRVGMTLFRFLLFRGVWKLAIWCWFLWRVSRLDLRLIPGHPDRAGGLGPLEGVHERFTPLVAALSVLESASLAESISAGTLAAAAIYPWLTMVLLVDGVLFLGPLLVFTDKLWEARTRGVGLYSGLAARYVTEFEAKWTNANVPQGPELLGTPDIQSMADLANAVAIVKGMRWITVGPRLLTMVTMAAIVPLAPLLLFRYPIADLAEKFFSRLIGL
jgi:hypothetical protein